jgi:hypothetical protein
LARLDAAAIRAGALADLAILAPTVAVYAGLRGAGAVTGNGATNVTAVIGAVLAPLAGGAAAGRRPVPTPWTHGAIAAGVASIAFIAFRLVDAVVRNRPVHVASVAILFILSMTLGLAGGFFGSRGGSRGGSRPLTDSAP